ncbi:MAG: hypothetical protein Q4P72_00715, partial [Eubacteriales bacterium]|nr:hypothetical protein [Eubacteriales bacterium]
SFLKGANGTLSTTEKTGLATVEYYVNPTAKKTMADVTAPTIVPETGYSVGDPAWKDATEAALDTATAIDKDLSYTAQYKKLADIIGPVDPTDPKKPEKPEGYVTVSFLKGANGTLSTTEKTGLATVEYYVNPTAKKTMADITAPTVVPETGYSIGDLAWKDIAEAALDTATVIDKDLSYTAQYKKLDDIIGPVDPDNPGVDDPEKPATHVTVTFVAGEHGTIAGKRVYYVNPKAGKTIADLSKPAITAAAGYTHTGWDLADTTAIDKDLTVTAKYEAVVVVPDIIGPVDPDNPGADDLEKPAPHVTVTFAAGEHGTIAGKRVYYVNPKAGKTLADLTKPAITAAEGYTHTGWDLADTTPIDKDLTVTAKYEAKAPANAADLILVNEVRLLPGEALSAEQIINAVILKTEHAIGEQATLTSKQLAEVFAPGKSEYAVQISMTVKGDAYTWTVWVPVVEVESQAGTDAESSKGYQLQTNGLVREITDNSETITEQEILAASRVILAGNNAGLTANINMTDFGRVNAKITTMKASDASAQISEYVTVSYTLESEGKTKAELFSEGTQAEINGPSSPTKEEVEASVSTALADQDVTVGEAVEGTNNEWTVPVTFNADKSTAKLRIRIVEPAEGEESANPEGEDDGTSEGEGAGKTDAEAGDPGKAEGGDTGTSEGENAGKTESEDTGKVEGGDAGTSDGESGNTEGESGDEGESNPEGHVRVTGDRQAKVRTAGESAGAPKYQYTVTEVSKAMPTVREIKTPVFLFRKAKPTPEPTESKPTETKPTSTTTTTTPTAPTAPTTTKPSRPSYRPTSSQYADPTTTIARKPLIPSTGEATEVAIPLILLGSAAAFLVKRRKA